MRYFKIHNLPASSTWSDKFVSKLRDKQYRHAYMAEGVRSWVARQIRVLRENRNWSQSDLGHETGKPQSAISRLEDPDYGRLSLQSLFDIANAYDVAVLVQFVGWDEWLGRMDNVSTEAMEVRSFDASALVSGQERQPIIVPPTEFSNENYISITEQNPEPLGVLQLPNWILAGAHSVSAHG